MSLCISYLFGESVLLQYIRHILSWLAKLNKTASTSDSQHFIQLFLNFVRFSFCSPVCCSKLRPANTTVNAEPAKNSISSTLVSGWHYLLPAQFRPSQTHAGLTDPIIEPYVFLKTRSDIIQRSAADRVLADETGPAEVGLTIVMTLSESGHSAG